MKRVYLISLASFVIYFLSWVLVYSTGLNKLAIQSEDTLPAVFTPVTILKEGTLYLDTYYQMLLERYPQPDDKNYELGNTPFYVEKILVRDVSSGMKNIQETHYVSAFPIITGLLAIPFYAPFIWAGIPITWNNLIFLSHFASAGIMAVNVGLFYFILRRYLVQDEKQAGVLALVYAFGTINFALISQALWQQGSVQLFVLLGLYFLLRSLEKSEDDYLSPLFFSGFFFGWGILARPTSLLPAVILSLLVYYRHRTSLFKLFKSAVFYIFGLVPPAAFFFWYNNTFYKSLSNQGYAQQLGDSWRSNIVEGFLGLWISPSKGLLIYSPILIFAFIGLYIMFKQKSFKKYLPVILSWVIVVVHILILGKWKHWYGGWSFGYRMASDVIPFLVLLLIPFVQSPYYERFKKWFFGIFALSVFMQIFGLIFFDGVWHAAYDRGFTDTRWLWSIRDSEIAFNIRRILVKLGVMYQACPKCLPRQ